MKTIVVLISVLFAGNVFAGKLEREHRTKEVEPAIAKATEAFKNSCKKDLKINVDWEKFSTRERLDLVTHFVNSIAEGAPKYCTDQDSQTAMGKLTSIEYTVAKETAFSFDKGKGKAETDGTSFPSWDMVTAKVDN